MIRIITLLILFAIAEKNFAQKASNDFTKNCEQYHSILEFVIKDTASFKTYNVKEFCFRPKYEHMLIRMGIVHSFKRWCEQTRKVVEKIDLKKNSKADAKKYSTDFKKCFIPDSISVANFDLIFDRYDNKTVFVFALFNRSNYINGESYLFLFDQKQKFTVTQMGMTE